MRAQGPESHERNQKHHWPSSVRLLLRGDYQRAYRYGRRFSSPLFTAVALNVREEAGDVSRVGFTTPRALGGAVVRNRIRRRLREAVRLHYHELGGGWHLVLHPRRALLDAEFGQIETEVIRYFRSLIRS